MFVRIRTRKLSPAFPPQRRRWVFYRCFDKYGALSLKKTPPRRGREAAANKHRTADHREYAATQHIEPG